MVLMTSCFFSKSLKFAKLFFPSNWSGTGRANKTVNLADGPGVTITSIFSILCFQILKDCEDISGFAFSSNMFPSRRQQKIREISSLSVE